MTTMHEKAVNFALAEESRGVHEIPLGSNRGPRVEYYQGFDFLPGVGYPWCASFFDACWANAGHKLPYPTAGAFDLDNWARRSDWEAPLEHLIPGDGICLNIGSGHYCMYLEHSANKVHTVNGNCSDRVEILDWPINEIRGCMHIPEAHVLPKPKEPMYVVTTSINGHRRVVLTHRSLKAIKPFLPLLGKKYGNVGFTLKKVRKGVK